MFIAVKRPLSFASRKRPLASRHSRPIAAIHAFESSMADFRVKLSSWEYRYGCQIGQCGIRSYANPESASFSNRFAVLRIYKDADTCEHVKILKLSRYERSSPPNGSSQRRTFLDILIRHKDLNGRQQETPLTMAHNPAICQRGETLGAIARRRQIRGQSSGLPRLRHLQLSPQPQCHVPCG